MTNYRSITPCCSTCCPGGVCPHFLPSPVLIFSRIPATASRNFETPGLGGRQFIHSVTWFAKENVSELYLLSCFTVGLYIHVGLSLWRMEIDWDRDRGNLPDQFKSALLFHPWWMRGLYGSSYMPRLKSHIHKLQETFYAYYILPRFVPYDCYLWPWLVPLVTLQHKIFPVLWITSCFHAVGAFTDDQLVLATEFGCRGANIVLRMCHKLGPDAAVCIDLPSMINCLRFHVFELHTAGTKSVIRDCLDQCCPHFQFQLSGVTRGYVHKR